MARISCTPNQPIMSDLGRSGRVWVIGYYRRAKPGPIPHLTVIVTHSGRLLGQYGHEPRSRRTGARRSGQRVTGRTATPMSGCPHQAAHPLQRNPISLWMNTSGAVWRINRQFGKAFPIARCGHRSTHCCPVANFGRYDIMAKPAPGVPGPVVLACCMNRRLDVIAPARLRTNNWALALRFSSGLVRSRWIGDVPQSLRRLEKTAVCPRSQRKVQT